MDDVFGDEKDLFTTKRSRVSKPAAKKKPTAKAAAKAQKKQEIQQPEAVTDDLPIPFKETSITVETKSIVVPTPPIEIRRGLSQRMWDYSVAWVETLNAEIAYKRARYTLPCLEEAYRAPLMRAGVRAAIDWLVAEIAKATTLSVEWVQARLIRIYDDSMLEQPIVDRKGHVVGYKKDFGAALRAVELAGKSIGMFKAEHALTVGGEVRHLLVAVGLRGKPTLEQRRNERVVAEVPKLP